MAYNTTTGEYTPATGALNASAGQVIASATWNSIFTSLALALTQLGQQRISSIPVTKTGTTGSQATTDSSLIINASGGYTLTLLAAVTYPGRWLYIKSIAAQTIVSASANVVPLVGGAASTALLSNTAGKWAILQSDGANWVIMASN